MVNLVTQTPSNSVMSSNDAIMVMLQVIKELNVALAQRMDRVEQSSLRGTPLNPRSYAIVFHHIHFILVLPS